MRKHRIVAALFAIVSAYIVLTSSSNGRATAANTGNTGAPNESSTCANCHSGGVFGVTTVSIQAFQVGTTTPVTSYLPGTAYDMRVTVTKTSGTPVGYGFQMTALTTPGNLPQSGYSNLASNVKQKLITTGTYTGRTYVEHNGVTNNNQFNFRWTAPATGVGAIRFYASGVCVNGNGGTGGDNAGVTTLTLTQAIPLAASLTSTNPSCFGFNNGSVDLTVSGGTAPYTFVWNTGSTDEDLTNLAIGTYSVTVTDAANATTTASVTLTQPSLLEINVSATDATVPGTNGILTIQGTGGSAPYTYSINNTVVPNQTNYELPADCYTVRITDALGCFAESIICIDEPAPYIVESLTTNTTCAGASDGNIHLNVFGGTPPYTYAWNDGNTDQDRDNLSAGFYTVEIFDINGYSYSETFEITSPEPVNAIADFDPISCNGQSTLVAISATGGNAPYTGIGNFIVTAGSYEYTVTDANGCSSSTSISVDEPAPLTVSATNASLPCTGGSANIEVTANGGTAPYTGVGIFEITSPGVYEYFISDAVGCTNVAYSTVAAIDAFNFTLENTNTTCANLCDGSVVLDITNFAEPLSILWNDGATDQNRTNLCTGQYSFSITDGSGCTLQGTTSISEPSALSVQGSASTIACFGENATVQLNAIGGTGTLTFTWNNENIESNSLSSPAGTYSFGVSDSNGCSVSSTLSIAQPNPLELSISVTAPLCFGESNGTAAAVVSGGTTPYSYQWSTGGFLGEISNLSAGSISLQVTDNNDCVVSANTLIQEPAALIVNVVSFDIESDGTATVDLSIEGGTAPYDILWTTGSTSEDVTLPANASNSAQVTDANGCEVITQLFVTPLDIAQLQPVEFVLYPNPSAANPNVQSAINGELVIMELTGKTVFEAPITAGITPLSLEHLPTGIYQVRFESAHGIRFSKWVKQ
ncbi:MAG: choice-of-anchor V domain-containing protein [Flavobacteriales bacterium]